MSDAGIMDGMFNPIWLGLTLIGAILAVVDHRVIGVPAFGVILLSIFVGGIVVQYIKPVNFADGGWSMGGVMGMTAAGGALAGYVPAWIASWAIRRNRGSNA